MDDITQKIDYDGTTTPVPDDAVHKSAEYNDRRSELQNSVTNTGLALNDLDTVQLSKAMFANGIAAQSMQDNSVSANSVELTPITGASGLRIPVAIAPETPDYSALNGAIFSFNAANTNTGNMTVNVGQTTGTLVGSKSLFLEDGSTQVPAGRIVSGRYFKIRYDSSLDSGSGAFILLESEFFLSGNKAVTTTVATFSTTLTNALTSPFLQADGLEVITVTLSGLVVGDVIEVEGFAVTTNSVGNHPQIALFVDAISASLAVAANDGDTTVLGGLFNNVKAWFTATGSTHTFKMRVAGVSATTTVNNAFGGTAKSWISATRLNPGLITIT
ncbi:hypothetical protein KAR91_18755 [Candidatus Pacearchaeota archaeon]|nr:hypothetical protein [Candidatus Pacearchaeota archaeon]